MRKFYYSGWLAILISAVLLHTAAALPVALGRTFYVAKTGSNANVGTSPTKPLRTLAAAVARMQAGDRCMVMAGVYHQTLCCVRSGVRGRPMVFQAYRHQRVVLDAADTITHWRTGKNHAIQSAPMGWTLGPGMNQVFLNGKMILEARYPVQQALNPFVPGGARVSVPPGPRPPFSTHHQVISPAFAHHPANFFRGAWFVGQVGWAWASECGLVRASSATGQLTLNHVSKPWWFSGPGRGYVTGLLRLLQTPRQWEYKAGQLYVDLPRGINPSAYHVEARRRAWCVDINHCSWVTVRGFYLFAGSVRLVGNHCVLSHCHGRYMGHFTVFPWSQAAGTGGINHGQCAVEVSGNDNQVRHCDLRWSAGSGIVLQGRRNRITRNVIADMDYAGTYACCLDMLRGGHNRITFNTMFNAGRDIIQLGQPEADIVEYNNLSRPGLLCMDLGVTYSWGTNGHGTRIAFNWIHDNMAGGGSHPGVYLDNGCKNFVVDHNVIWNCPRDAGVRVNGPCAGEMIVNNTLFHCLPVGARIYAIRPPPHHPNWPQGVHYQSINNLYLGNSPQSCLQNVAKHDFRLSPGCAGLHAGKAVPGLANPIGGRAPDLGAYQTGQPYWIPGVKGKK